MTTTTKLTGTERKDINNAFDDLHSFFIDRLWSGPKDLNVSRRTIKREHQATPTEAKLWCMMCFMRGYEAPHKPISSLSGISTGYLLATVLGASAAGKLPDILVSDIKSVCEAENNRRKG